MSGLLVDCCLGSWKLCLTLTLFVRVMFLVIFQILTPFPLASYEQLWSRDHSRQGFCWIDVLGIADFAVLGFRVLVLCGNPLDGQFLQAAYEPF